MKLCRAEVLPISTLEAMREAARASSAGEARTWLPTITPWQRALAPLSALARLTAAFRLRRRLR